MKQKFKTKSALSFLAFLLIGLGTFLVPPKLALALCSVTTPPFKTSNIFINGSKGPVKVSKGQSFKADVFVEPNVSPPGCTANAASNISFSYKFLEQGTNQPTNIAEATSGSVYRNTSPQGFSGEANMSINAIGAYTLKVTVKEFGFTRVLPETVIVSVAEGLAIQPDAERLPEAEVGKEYSTQLSGAGGTTPYTWTLEPALPFWLGIDSTGKVGGIPPEGDVNKKVDFTVTLKDSTNQTVTKAYNVFILPKGGATGTDCFANIASSQVQTNKAVVGLTEQFIIRAEVILPGDASTECQNLDNVVFALTFTPGITISYSVNKAVLIQVDGKPAYAYRAGNTVTTQQALGSTSPPAEMVLSATVTPQGGTAHKIGENVTIKIDQTSNDHPVTTPLEDVGTPPVVPPASGGPSLGSVIANTLLDTLTAIFSTVIAVVSSLVAFVVLSLVVPLIEALIGIQTYKDSFVAVILPGWIVLRNLSNIFFILVLLVIGLATIFRVQGYQYKQLLVNLIIAAVLVNFSLVIGQSILGLADTVQTQLLPPPKTDGTFEYTPVRRLAYVLIAGPSLNNLSKSYKNIITPGTAGQGVGNLFLPFVSLAMALGTGVLFVAVAAMLFIRIIALWILLMLSPLAYVAGVLPNTKSFQKMWWDKFLKYAFYAVILAFFLNIAAFISSNGSTEVDISLSKSIMADLVSGGSNPGFATQYQNISDFVFTIGSNLLVMIFLIIGMKATSSLSLIGSKAIGDFAEKGFKSPLWVAKKGGEIANTYKGKKTAEYLAVDPDSRKRRTISALFNPISSGKAVLDNWTNAKKQDQEKIRAAATDVASRLPFTRGDETYKLAELMQQSVDKQQEEATKEDVARNIARVKELSEKKNLNQEDRTKLQATIKVIAEQGGMKELAQALKFAATDEGMRGFMQGMVNNGQLDSYSTGVLGKKLDEIGGKSGEQWIRGAFRYDESKRLAHIGDNVGPAGGASLFDSAKTAADAEADAERLRDPNVSEAKLESIRKEKFAEEYKKLKTPEEREQWRNGEAAFLMSKNQAKAVAKMSPKALAEDTPASTFVATTASGDVEANDRLVELALTADARKAEMENTHIRADQQEAIGDALRDETKRNEFINRMQKKLVKEYRKKGKNFTEADVKDEAERNFRAFAGSYAKVNFSGNSYSKIPEKLKDPVASVLAKDDKYEQFGIAYDGLEGKVRGKVQNKANRVLSKISHFNDTELADAFSGVADTKARDAMLDSAKTFVHNSFADRLNTRDAGIPTISKAEEEDLTEDIIKSVNTVRSTHAGEDLKDPAKRALLKSDLETLLGGKFATRTISGAPINTTTIDNMVNQVIAGL